MKKLTLLGVAIAAVAHAQPALDASTARAALAKAVAFFRTEVSVHGSYLWRYSEDLSQREGEGAASATTAWVQPPGTPTVGLAFLDAHRQTGETYLRDAAIETGRALVMGQLQSGGWDYRIEFDPQTRASWQYRRPPAAGLGLNVTTLDDDTTQSALRFLMQLDKELDFKDQEIHECVIYGLDALLTAQYPNGAWPQRFSAPPDPTQFPVKKAGYPESWSRELTNPSYAGYYTFNDNTISDVVEMMLDAFDCYGDARYRGAAMKAGDFILLAQMPDPQPAWAQQYDPEMHPAWARKFEPPAITGGESQSVIRTLITLAERTGERRFLEPVPRAIAYLRASLLPDGRLARFYELKTNTPIFFTKDYELTYDGSDTPTHYSFYAGSSLDALDMLYRRVQSGSAGNVPAPAPAPEAVERAAAEAVETMDPRGAWLSDEPLATAKEMEPGAKTIATTDFVRNIETLSAFIALHQEK